MKALSKLTMKRYIITNAILAASFANVALFGERLAMGEAFTAGLVTGIGVGWLVFAVAGIIELKRPGRAWDERTMAIFSKASGFAFWVVVLVASVLSALLRSETIGLSWTAADLCGTLSNVALGSFALSSLVISRKS
ncbi:MAG: hypothetical protein KKA67_06605 [Spirochaetes bacterium]|nr:hypothetical protein [Spirochaetota bacterium]MBU1080193.1 hypothetical protein [Spirochaetota bacterium]